MAKITDILNILRGFAHEAAYQPGFDDNCGLNVGSERGSADRVLLCLDCSEVVVEEAKETHSRLIISHHPLLFLQTKTITDSTPTGRAVLAAAESGITVYSAHTNLDFCRGGLNDYAAELIGLKDTTYMQEISGVEIGRIGSIKPTTLKQLKQHLSQVFNDRYIRMVGNADTPLRRIAVINGGAGSVDYIDQAARLGADCYVSADFPHHALLYAAQSGVALLAMQHYNMEQIYLERLANILSNKSKLAGLAVEYLVSRREKNPINQEEL